MSDPPRHLKVDYIREKNFILKIYYKILKSKNISTYSILIFLFFHCFIRVNYIIEKLKCMITKFSIFIKNYYVLDEMDSIDKYDKKYISDTL